MSANSAIGVRIGARERLLATACELFSWRGIRNVGVDEIISRSGVAKATFYRHFPSEDALALAFLERRARLWTHSFVEAGARRRRTTAEERLLAIVDVFDDWFRRPEDFDTCSFINVLLEMGPSTRWERPASVTSATSAGPSAAWPRRRGCATRRTSPAPGTSS